MPIDSFYIRMSKGFWKRKIGTWSGNSWRPSIRHSSLKYLAAMFDCSISELYEIANDPARFYKTYYIPKHNGGLRRIDSPKTELKNIQKWILTDILSYSPCSKYAKAYVKNKSIRDNAQFHQNQKIVLTLDVKDFFSSITENHIFNFFNQSCGYEPSVAVLFTKLCTYEGVLPQGAPTSPTLSNLVLKQFDEVVGDYCKGRGIRFTRYADDMTFSGSEIDIAALLYYVDQQLASLGLERHPEKLKVMRQHNRQKTTGIVVNSINQVPREYRMRIRQEVHYIRKYGLDSHVDRIGEEKQRYLTSLRGRINYVCSINPEDHKMAEYLEYIDALIIVEKYR